MSPIETRSPTAGTIDQTDAVVGGDSPMKKKNLFSSKNEREAYQVSLSFGFVSILLFLSSLASFHVGKLVRERIVNQVETNAIEIPSWLEWVGLSNDVNSDDTTMESPSNAWIRCKDTPEDSICSMVNSEAASSDDDSDSDSSDDEEDHKHSLGQQLLVELSGNLNREELVTSLLKLSSSQGWTLISHHCPDHAMCRLLFDDGQIILNGQVLNIFSADDGSLMDWLDSMPFVERWGLKPRGTPWERFDAGLTDLYNGMLGSMLLSYKRLVVRADSPFQEVAIYDTIDPMTLPLALHQEATSEGESSYIRDNAHMFQPDRQLFLDGVVQSRKYGERAYHEALVHPAMLMHPHPERVAIVGAGEGATLREVLKHRTLKEVIMIEIDAYVMDLSKQYLTQWNDCSDLILPEGMVNPTGNCFDDPRAKVYAKDAIRWFIAGYPENTTIASEKLFDVMIMDALDPGDKVEFSDILFDNTDLVATFHRSLSPEGIFVSQMGEELYLNDPNPLLNRDRHSIIFMQNMGKVGFHRLFTYDEKSTRFGGDWSFLVASKSSDTSRWFLNPAQIDLELHQRAISTKSGTWPFHYVDGATISSYQEESRAVTTLFCRYTLDYASCQRGPGLYEGFNVPAVKALAIVDGKIVAQQDLEAGSYVGLEECVHQTWDIPSSTAVLIDSLMVSSPWTRSKWNSWHWLAYHYGAPALRLGENALTLDLGNDVWMRQCPITKPALEPFELGVADSVLGRFWRIHSCAANRAVEQRVPAGSKVTCDTALG